MNWTEQDTQARLSNWLELITQFVDKLFVYVKKGFDIS